LPSNGKIRPRSLDCPLEEVASSRITMQEQPGVTAERVSVAIRKGQGLRHPVVRPSVRDAKNFAREKNPARE